jgi:hypothetical protein
MAELENATATRDAIGKLNAEAILTYKTDPMEDDDVSWVSPQELRAAATRLREAVQAGSPEAETILETYEKRAPTALSRSLKSLSATLTTSSQ